MTSGDLNTDLNENLPKCFRNDFRAFQRIFPFFVKKNRSYVWRGLNNDPPRPVVGNPEPDQGAG